MNTKTASKTMSIWTPEMKAINKSIVKDIAEILPRFIAGFTDSGYELAAREIVKAIVSGKIDGLKVEYPPMSEKQKEDETDFARSCFIQEFDRQLAAGEITQQRHDELVAKVNAA